LDQFRHVPILRQYESAIEKIINRVNISPNPDDASLSRYIQFEVSTVSQGNEHLGPLLEYIRAKKSIRIAYRKFSDDKLKEYELHPYLLKEYHNRWYVVAFDVNGHGIRTFGLERIEKLETAEKKFTVDKNFNADHFFKYSIGITEISDKPQEVILSFDPVPGKFLLTQPIHVSQTLLEQNKNEIHIGLNVLITQELITFILGYGAGVRVLKPTKLCRQIEEIAKAIAEQYK
jgi:predicted DNA-binding transcriptional regulator YafY